MTKPLLTKIKLLTILMLILTFTVVSLSFLPKAKAETEIISLTPSSGYVGTTVQLIGNISSEGGQYIVQFDEIDIASGNATGYEVTETFNVTSTFVGNNTFAGDHNVTLIDVKAEENDTATFTVLTSYSLEILPKLEPPAQRQEGDNVTILLNVTGGEPSKTLVANITVQTPTNASYTNLLNVTTLNTGSGSANITYPESFSTSPNTNFTGGYKVFRNETLTGAFTIGLTNASEYHRFQCVNVKAVGYKQNENVTITISFEEATIHSKNVTAEMGVIHYANWTIPSNASIGTYTLNITSISPNATIKEVPDTQDFTVPGFDVNVTTRNLAGEFVQDITVLVKEDGELVDNKTSGAKGLVGLKLEVANYSCEAKYKDEKVGVFSLNVTGELSLDFNCSLTNLRIFVKDKVGHNIPEVKLYLVPENETLTTDIDGTAVAHSLLPFNVKNITYVLNASRYDDKHFNTTIITQLPAKPWVNRTVICPTLKLHVNVTDAKNQPIQNATVQAREFMGGLPYEGNTVDGNVTLNCVFGKYNVRVYANGIKLNETTIDLFENQSLLINCTYYGLKVYVTVVDYFGQPIPNANVTLQCEGLPLRSNRTEYNGVATFSDFIGGSVQITIYLNDQTQPCVKTTSSVDSSTTIRIKIGRYVLIAGILVETSQLATALIIAAAIILILSIEVYRRKHLKKKKSSS